MNARRRQQPLTGNIDPAVGFASKLLGDLALNGEREDLCSKPSI
jgi:hypothetical protein